MDTFAMNSSTSRLQHHSDQFKAAAPVESAELALKTFETEVLRHLMAMPEDEWRRLRAFGNNRQRFVNHDDVAMPNLTRETLVKEFFSVDCISIAEVLVPEYRANTIEIAQIERRPLFYVQGEGVYIMEEVGASVVPMTRTLWVTIPAYPPSW